MLLHKEKKDKNKTEKSKKPKYETNLEKFEEMYLIPKSNNYQISVGQDKYYDQQRNMAKCLKKMWKSFTKYNNRISKWESFLALKRNSFKFKAARKLLDWISIVLWYSDTTTKNKKNFFNGLVENYHAKEIIDRADDKFSENSQDTLQYLEFYNKNLKMKAFFTLLRYKKK